MKPFKINITDDVLDDLRVRLQRTRWPDQIEEQNWRQGTELGFLKRLCNYWAEQFDWKSAEARLNAQPQFQTVIDEVGIYFIHARSPEPNAVPLLLLNGWPSSVFEYLDVIPLLTKAGFDVVAPALPGYGFSDKPRQFGMNGPRIAGLFTKLMSELGYEQFLAHGSDWGGFVVDRIRLHYPEKLIGAHFSNVHSNYPRPENPTPEEQSFLGQAQGWNFTEGAYAMIQGTKPQSLGYGLNDSPAGLASWVTEKFRTWSDGDLEEVYGLDGVCANLTLYWATGTITSSMRLYFETFTDPAMRVPPERGTVPVGVIVFPADILPAPRAWGERWFNIVHWTEASRGGHFGAWEAPEQLAEDLRTFADQLADLAGKK